MKVENVEGIHLCELEKIDRFMIILLFEDCGIPGGGGGGLRFMLDGMCFLKRPIWKVFNMLKLYP